MKDRKAAAEVSKRELIAGIVQVRRHIIETALQLPVEAQDEIFLGTWDLKDLLAHMKGWDEANRQAIEEILEGQLPSFYEHAGGDWSGYNAILVQRHRKQNLLELLQDLEDSQTALLTRLEAVDAQELDRERGIRYKGWKVTIARLLKAELHDEQEHLSQLQAFARRASPPREPGR